MKKYIENSKNYFVDENGDIYRGERKLRRNLDHSGYRSVSVRYLDGTLKRMYVHRIVALAFLPNPQQLKVVNHKNLDRSDNRVENLEWVSNRDNILHAIRMGACNLECGTRKNAMYEPELIHEVCRLLQDGFRNVDISKRLDVPISLPNIIRSGKQWKHISENYSFRKISRTRRLSESTVKWVKEQISLGKTDAEISNMTDKRISRKFVRRIRDGFCYSDVK